METAEITALREQYLADIRGWNWSGILADCLDSVDYDRDADGYVGTAFIGTVFSLTPSGKYYTPYAHSNVTEAEAEQDEIWFECLEEVCDEFDVGVINGEGDPCDMFITKYFSADGFVHGYVSCALWTAAEELGDRDTSDVRRSSMCDVIKECVSFQIIHAELLQQAYDLPYGYTPESAGRDFWLSRNGHGAGFFDRGREPYWRALQSAAKTYGSREVVEDREGYVVIE